MLALCPFHASLYTHTRSHGTHTVPTYTHMLLLHPLCTRREQALAGQGDAPGTLTGP